MDNVLTGICSAACCALAVPQRASFELPSSSVVLIKQALYVKPNIETRSCNHYCSGKAISITYYEYVFVALGIQHAMHMRSIIIRGLSGST
jgi:hypothetical protein